MLVKVRPRRTYILGMNAAMTERPTALDQTPTLERGDSAFLTFPPYSKNRDAGCQWYCAMMALTTPASNDVARFAAGLAGLAGAL